LALRAGVPGGVTSIIEDHLGDVAQLGERLVCNQKVAGSNPVVSILLAPAGYAGWARRPGLAERSAGKTLPGGAEFGTKPDPRLLAEAGRIAASRPIGPGPSFRRLFEKCIGEALL
jgi:hypothetical protein